MDEKLFVLGTQIKPADGQVNLSIVLMCKSERSGISIYLLFFRRNSVCQRHPDTYVFGLFRVIRW